MSNEERFIQWLKIVGAIYIATILTLIYLK